MARIRTIKPEFWSSPTLASVSRDARLTFVGLWNHADDYGRCEAIPRSLLGDLYPFDQDVTEDDVVRWVDELASAGLVQLYERRRRHYLYVVGWDEHQRIDRPSQPRCPAPDDHDSTPLASLANPQRDTSEGIAGPSLDPSARNVGAWERGSVGAWEGGEADAADAASAPDPIDEQFEDFWARYPRNAKTGKPGGGGDRKPTRRRWRNLTQQQRDQALAAVDNYAAYCRRDDAEFPKHALTWLNAESWEQWQEPALPPVQTRNGGGREPPTSKGARYAAMYEAAAEQARQEGR